jgi:arylsulfatase A-like enzyme
MKSFVSSAFRTFVLAVASTWSAALFAAQPAGGKLNVLFIAVDDLRPELGCYGTPIIKTPNIDRLAAQGTLFERAYCQQAVCNPSRVALLTSLRPDTTKVYDLPTRFRDKVPDALTLPQHFKHNGYFTLNIGKIFHTAHGNTEDVISWSEIRKFPTAPRISEENRKLGEKLKKEFAKRPPEQRREIPPSGYPWEALDVPDIGLTDGMFAENGVKMLREMKDRKQPFFLAVGFHNPHLPFVAPKKYWDMYADAKIEPARNPNPPQGAPPYAGNGSRELRAYYGVPKEGPIPEAQARDLKRAYYAAVSYVDAGVGRLLDELERLNLRDKTVVILWGDHGWHLGEHGGWGKDTNYEIAARAPLIISVPGQKAVGKKSPALVEFVDIFPSLVEICGLPQPGGLEGFSFRPLLDEPRRAWKTATFNQFPKTVEGVGQGMGRSIRTDRYRLVEWTVPGKDYLAHELYDEVGDPEENVNLAGHPEQKVRVQELVQQLHAGWKAALPR